MIDRTKDATYFTNKKIKPLFLIIHHTGSNKDMANYLAEPGDGRRVSVHFHINRQGVLTQYENIIDLIKKWVKVGYHAGKSTWKYNNEVYNGLNNYSIGIELDGDGKTPFTQSQLDQLWELSIVLMKAFKIDPINVLGHKEISPGRKFDPSPMDMGQIRSKLSTMLIESSNPTISPELQAWTDIYEHLANTIPSNQRDGHKVMAAFNLLRTKWKSHFGE